MPHSRYHLAAVLGSPIRHSRSPALHGFWLAQYGLDGAYLALDIAPSGLEAALRALPALGFAGCNLTIPLKEAALALVDRVDPAAQRIGAINTVVVGPDGSLDGRNTDAFGFAAALHDALPDRAFATGPAVVIGAGGASRAVLQALLDDGVPEIRLLNRTEARASALAAAFGPKVQTLPWHSRDDALSGAALLVNATSQGMGGQSPLDLRLDALPQTALVTDLVYTPLETPLLAAARRAGYRAIDGLGMLLHQARPAFEAWFGIDPQVTPALRRTIEATL